MSQKEYGHLPPSGILMFLWIGLLVVGLIIAYATMFSAHEPPITIGTSPIFNQSTGNK